LNTRTTSVHPPTENSSDKSTISYSIGTACICGLALSSTVAPLWVIMQPFQS